MRCIRSGAKVCGGRTLYFNRKSTKCIHRNKPGILDKKKEDQKTEEMTDGAGGSAVYQNDTDTDL